MQEYEFTKPLGDAVKRARGKLNITQNDVAELIDKDVRTILNIENYRGNPKMEVLYPLIRALKLDPYDIFFPDGCKGVKKRNLFEILLADCSESEIETLIPICESVISTLRATNSISIK